MFGAARLTRCIVIFTALVMVWPSAALATPPSQTTVKRKRAKKAQSKKATKATKAARAKKTKRVRAKRAAKAKKAAKATRGKKLKRGRARRAAKARKRSRARRATRARKRARARRAAKSKKFAKPKKITRSAKSAKTGSSTLLTTEEGRKVLQTAQAMIDERQVVIGSCWDWVQAVYIRAGFLNKRGLRRTVFKGSKKKGVFAKPSQLQPGDWVYHVNHQYRGVGHSAIFVRWVDRSRNLAKTISYAGSRRNKPGRYGTYDLSSVYRIIRPTK